MSSLALLNRRVSKTGSPSFCRHVQFITSEREIFELGGFSIGYVQLITSGLIDNQFSSFFLPSYPVFSPLNGKTLNAGVPHSIMSSPSPLS